MEKQNGISFIWDLRISKVSTNQIFNYAKTISQEYSFEVIALTNDWGIISSSNHSPKLNLENECLFRLIKTEKTGSDPKLINLIFSKAKYSNIFFVNVQGIESQENNSPISNQHFSQKHKISNANKSKNIFQKLGSEKYREIRGFNEFLCRAYTIPIITPPFNFEERRCFSIMEGLAGFLSKFVESVSNPPSVDVIMPTFNRVGLLPKSIESVLKQSYPNFNLIIIDDGSVDSTKEYLGSLQDNRLKILTNQKNRGQSYSLNKAILSSNAQYIAYLDSDNTWEKNYLSTMMGAFTHLPDADAIYSGQYLYRNDHDNFIGARFGSFNRSLLFNNNYIDRNSFIHKRSLHSRISGYDENLKRFVDWDYILRLSQLFKIYSVPVFLTNYFYELDSQTMTGNIKYYIDSYKIREKSMFSKNDTNGQLNSGNILKQPVKYFYLEKARIPKTAQPPFSSFNKNHSIEKETFHLYICDTIHSDNYGPPQTIEKRELLGRLKMICSTSDSDIVLLDNSISIQEESIYKLQEVAYSDTTCAATIPQLICSGQPELLKENIPYADSKYPCSITISTKSNNIESMPIFHCDESLSVSHFDFYCVYLKKYPLNSFFMSYSNSVEDFEFLSSFIEYSRYILNFSIKYVSRAKAIHKSCF